MEEGCGCIGESERFVVVAMAAGFCRKRMLGPT